MTNLHGRWAKPVFVAKSIVALTMAGAGMAALGCLLPTSDIQDAGVVTLFHEAGGEGCLEELTRGSDLTMASLDLLDAASELAVQTISFRLWQAGRGLADATKEDLIGMPPGACPGLHKSPENQRTAHFRHTADATTGHAPIEINAAARGAPIPDISTAGDMAGTGALIRADVLLGVSEAIRQHWMVVGAMAFLQIFLVGIGWRRAVDSQRTALADARRTAVEINERFLRRIGADLHDGPAQLVSLALLKLDSLRPAGGHEPGNFDEFETIRALLESCLQEIRHMASGLAPPHLEHLSLQKVLEVTIREHEQRTGTIVNAIMGALPADISLLHKVSIYRFVQQALHNAHRHAGGVGQAVHAAMSGTTLSIEVADAGTGFSPSTNLGPRRLGLAYMRDRIESLGGTFFLETAAGLGTTVRASFELEVEPDQPAKD